MTWWYFYWIAMEVPGVAGAQVLPMDNEFDLLYAHRWIEMNHGVIGVVQGFQKISHDQMLRYAEYVEDVMTRRKVQQLPSKGGLKIIPGGGPKKKGDPPDETPPAS